MAYPLPLTPRQNKKNLLEEFKSVGVPPTLSLPFFFPVTLPRSVPPHQGLSLLPTSKRMTWRWNWTARARGKVKPSRWWNVKEGRTAEIKSDSWWMSLDAYWQAKFAASLVRCDTFGPAGAAAAAAATAAAAALAAARLWNGLEGEKTGETGSAGRHLWNDAEIREFITVKIRLREAINSKLYLRWRWLRTLYHIRSGCTRDVTNAVPASY